MAQDIRVVEDEQVVTVVGHGDMDLEIAPQLAGEIETAVASGKNVVVDLRPAHYIDSAIIQNIIDGARAMSRAGRQLKVLVSRKGHPSYVLRMTGVDAMIDMVEDESSS